MLFLRGTSTTKQEAEWETEIQIPDSGIDSESQSHTIPWLYEIIFLYDLEQESKRLFYLNRRDTQAIYVTFPKLQFSHA